VEEALEEGRIGEIDEGKNDGSVGKEGEIIGEDKSGNEKGEEIGEDESGT
jgi:hypothetical protein